MKTTRKIFSVLLTACMLLSALPVLGLNGIAPKAEAYNVGDLIEYGTYPQSLVSDTGLVSALDSAQKTWRSFRYYSGNDGWDGHTGGWDGQMQPGDWMRFADFFFGGEKYRAVVFDEYRKVHDPLGDASDPSYQDDCGYYTGVVYYFRYEPIVWQVLDPSEGLVIAKDQIDSQPYQSLIYDSGEGYGYFVREKSVYQGIGSQFVSNDYTGCSVREWLNYDFCDTAFTAAQKNNVRDDHPIDFKVWNGSLVDAAQYTATVYDKVFLLSCSEAKNSSYGFDSTESYDGTVQSRIASKTDYASCQRGAEGWLLRDGNNLGYGVSFVYGSGFVESFFHYNVDTVYGIRPAVRLSSLRSDTAASQELFSEKQCSHAHTRLREIVPAGCESEGYSGNVYCAYCGVRLQDGAAVPSFGGHEWSKWVSYAIYSEEACRIRRCGVCGKLEQEPLAPKVFITDDSFVNETDGVEIDFPDGAFPSGTELKTSHRSYTLSENGRILEEWDITLEKDGNTVRPSKPVILRLKLPDIAKDLAILTNLTLRHYYNGKWTVMETWFDEDRNLCTVTDGFSPFELSVDEPSGEPEDPDGPDTPDEPDGPGQTAELCAWCGKPHEGFFGKITGIFHKILYFFAHLFGTR
ncbi:MAG: DUF6273 domain-containing protein [Clostridia bacterium]|nr:DUF6273 domain-containing protein [Clostridia bacterium]